MIRRALLALLALAPTVRGQFPEDVGPLTVGWRQVQFSHPLAASDEVVAWLYYPSLAPGPATPPDPSGGPYPLVAFVHGSGALPDDYDVVCTHLASWGFLVASIAQTASFTQVLPADTHAMLHWVTQESVEPESYFAGMTALEDDWSAIGHSSGAATLLILSRTEERVRRLATLEPSWMGSLGLEGFAGELLVVAASEDTITPPDLHAASYFETAAAARRRLYLEIEGGGHLGPQDVGSDASLAHEEELRLHRRALGTFLRAEVLGEEALYRDLLGGGLEGEPLSASSACLAPPHWATAPEPGQLAWGVARKPGDAALWLASAGSAALPTAYGVLGLDPTSLLLVHAAPLDPSGIAELVVRVPAALTGLALHLQGAAIGPQGGALTQAVETVLP